MVPVHTVSLYAILVSMVLLYVVLVCTVSLDAVLLSMVLLYKVLLLLMMTMTTMMMMMTTKMSMTTAIMITAMMMKKLLMIMMHFFVKITVDFGVMSYSEWAIDRPTDRETNTAYCRDAFWRTPYFSHHFRVHPGYYAPCLSLQLEGDPALAHHVRVHPVVTYPVEGHQFPSGILWLSFDCLA